MKKAVADEDYRDLNWFVYPIQFANNNNPASVAVNSILTRHICDLELQIEVV